MEAVGINMIEEKFFEEYKELAMFIFRINEIHTKIFTTRRLLNDYIGQYKMYIEKSNSILAEYTKKLIYNVKSRLSSYLNDYEAHLLVSCSSLKLNRDKCNI